MIDKHNKKKNPGKIKIYENNIPPELENETSFCCWKWVWKANKWTKPPCDINGDIGNHQQINHTLKEVLKAYNENEDIAGIGISLRKDNIFCGVDIDDCITKNGKVGKKEKKIIEACNSYTEISPSETGFRIFGIGKPETLGASKNKNIEVYYQGRYLTITGNIYKEKRPVRKIKKAINKITKKVRAKKSKGNDVGNSLASKGGYSTKKLISKLTYIDPDIHRDEWVKIAMALHDEFNGSDEGLILFERWSKGHFWHTGQAKKFDEESVEEVWNSIKGNTKNKRTKKTIDYFYEKSKPSFSLELPEDKKKPKQIKLDFPLEPYAGAPDLCKLLFEELQVQSAQPIEPYLFMSSEAVIQYLVGNRILTPGFGRTTATPMLGAGLSAAGKDLNVSMVLSCLANQLADFDDDDEFITFVKAIGEQTGTHTSVTSFLQSIHNKDMHFWTDTEASTIIKILCEATNNAHGGATLVRALNESFDGKFISGKNKADKKGNQEGIVLPQIPIVWLTQIDTFSQIITQELLNVGFLGRVDYYFDLENRKQISTFSDMFKEKPFKKKLLKTIRNFYTLSTGFKQQKAVLTEDARIFMMEWEKKYLLNKGFEENHFKFLRRLTMSAEKRLTAYSMIEAVLKDKPPIIDLNMVESHAGMLKYQLDIRNHIYQHEITGNDRYKDIKRAYILERDKKNYKGFVSWHKFYIRFKNLNRQKHPNLMGAKAMQIEIEALQNMGFLIYDDIEGKRGKWIKCKI